MNNQDIITELSLKWAGKTPIEIAIDVDVIFGGLIPLIPEAEHDAISYELDNIGVSVVAICQRKKAPKPIT